MTSSAARAFQCETEFLSGMRTNFEAAQGKQFRGTIWQWHEDDESERLRALLASNRVYDREKLKTLPSNRLLALRGFQRRFLFGKKRTGVAVASVLSPLSHYASTDGGNAPPIGVGELADHVRRLTVDAKVPQVIGVCSPTGFTAEAKAAKLSSTKLTVVLIEPGEQGGWNTSACGDDIDSRVLEIFDPESAKEKVQRVRELVEQRSTDLLTGSLSVSSLAESSGLPEDVVREGFRTIADEDPELRITQRDGQFLLFRGAPARSQEKKSMNVVDRIKQLFSSEGAEEEKINLLAERRASLAQRRDRIYGDIGKLEEREASFREQGKAAHAEKAHVKERRLAAQLVQLRKDIARQNTTAAMLNKQIDIISTDIHNLTLIQQGEMASLPDTQELTENAVKAEEMLETLKADADLVEGLGTGIEESLTSDDEMAILKEFAGDEGESAELEQPRRAPASQPPISSTPASSTPVEPTPEQERPDDAGEGRRADAEPN